MSTSFSIGLSLLHASQRGLDLVGQNIANAGTPGYHRQVVDLSPRVLGGDVGAGVEVRSVRRLVNPLIEQTLIANRGEGGRLNAELDSLRQLEALFTPRDGSIPNQIEKLFSNIEQLASRPEDTAQRRVVLSTAAGIASEFNRVAHDLGEISFGLRSRIDEAVNEINAKASRVAELNQQIQAVEVTGASANELRDQRDQLVSELSELIDVRTIDQPLGVVNVQAGSIPLVVGTLPQKLQSNVDVTGASFISAQGTTVPLSVPGGKLGGLLEARNGPVADFTQRLDALAREFARRLDGVQATGLGLNGPQLSASGVRNVASTTAALGTAAAGTAFPIESGTLYMTVTNTTTGQNELYEIPVDKDVDSLQTLAAKFATVTGGQVTGTVTSDGRLELQAANGRAFDFAGRTPSGEIQFAIPPGETAQFRVSGVYTGADNGDYTFQVTGGGTVGQDSVTLTVRAPDGTVVTVSLGQGYIPGTPISIGNGMTVSVGAGQTTAASFSSRVVGNPDETGALSALGINSLFSGRGASSLQVRAEVLRDPNTLAASRSGQAGDGSNLRRLSALRDQPFMASGRESFAQNFTSMVTEVGTRVQVADSEQSAQAALGIELQAQQQSVSGIDPNEELLTMVSLQRSFQMASRYIATVNTALEEVINMVR